MGGSGVRQTLEPPVKHRTPVKSEDFNDDH